MQGRGLVDSAGRQLPLWKPVDATPGGSTSKAAVQTFSDIVHGDEVTHYLGNIDDWNLDVLKLDSISGGRGLYVLGCALMEKHGFLALIHCSRTCFSKFITKIEAGYHDNPYHNSSHAADVMNGCNYFIHSLGLDKYLSKMNMCSLLLAAAIHDFEHPGVNNTFLVRTKDQLALLYNDSSVLERMHVARAFQVINNVSGDCNIFQALDDNYYRAIRATIISLVMATDLSQHMGATSLLRSQVAAGSEADIFEDSTMLMTIAIKSSDLGHTSKDLAIHLKWTDMICEEMFLQGDRERELGLRVSPFCDRNNKDTPKNQIGFFEFLVLPWWKVLASIDARFCLLGHMAELNYQHWKIVQTDAQSPPIAPKRQTIA